VASERDPREAVQGEVAGFDADRANSIGWLQLATSLESIPFSVGTKVRVTRLDAADPLRAMLGEVVEALESAHKFLEASVSIHEDPQTGDQGYGSSWDYEAAEYASKCFYALARLRTATEGGTDDGE
jgi:hypothetical protein